MQLPHASAAGKFETLGESYKDKGLVGIGPIEERSIVTSDGKAEPVRVAEFVVESHISILQGRPIGAVSCSGVIIAGGVNPMLQVLGSSASPDRYSGHNLTVWAFGVRRGDPGRLEEVNPGLKLYGTSVSTDTVSQTSFRGQAARIATVLASETLHGIVPRPLFDVSITENK